MNNIRLVMNPAGVRELMNSSYIQGELLKVAHDVANRVPDGEYRVDVRPGRNRAHARVSTKDKKGYKRELRTNALLKGLGAGYAD